MPASLLHDTAELPAPAAAPLRVVACAARTDQGARRAVNQDGMLLSGSLLALADGVGGHRAGEEASDLALDVLRREMHLPAGDPETELRHVICVANAAVLEAAERPSREHMATTLVAALVGPSAVTVAHVGDSRAYLLRQGRLRQLTVDHSLVSALVANGRLDPAAARAHPMRAVILRAVGLDAVVRPDVSVVPACSGDVLLLCSDGLSDVIDARQLERLAGDDRDLDHLVERLSAAARTAGSGDDVTVVAARMG